MEEKHLKTKKNFLKVIKLPSCKLERDGYSFNSVAEPLNLTWGVPWFPQRHGWRTTDWGVQVYFSRLVFNSLCTLSPTLFLSPAIRLSVAHDPTAPDTHLSEQFHVLYLYSHLFFCLKCSSGLAFLGNSRFRYHFFDVVFQLPRLSQPLLPLCFLWIGVMAFRTQSLICLRVHFPLWARVGHVWRISMTPAPNMGLAQGRRHKYSMSWKWLNFLMAWPCLWCCLLFPSI